MHPRIEELLYFYYTIAAIEYSLYWMPMDTQALLGKIIVINSMQSCSTVEYVALINNKLELC